MTEASEAFVTSRHCASPEFWVRFAQRDGEDQVTLLASPGFALNLVECIRKMTRRDRASLSGMRTLWRPSAFAVFSGPVAFEQLAAVASELQNPSEHKASQPSLSSKWSVSTVSKARQQVTHQILADRIWSRVAPHVQPKASRLNVRGRVARLWKSEFLGWPCPGHRTVQPGKLCKRYLSLERHCDLIPARRVGKTTHTHTRGLGV